MANEYYTPTGWPTTSDDGDSLSARNELNAVEDGFDKLPTLTGNADAAVFVNTGGTALVSTSASAARTLLSLVYDVNVLQWSENLQALVDYVTPATDRIPYVNLGAGTKGGTIGFIDEDDMSSNLSNATPSQQSIKAYIDQKVSDAGSYMSAPDGTNMLFYQASAPTGWLNNTGFYRDRLVYSKDTRGGDVYNGTRDFNSTINSFSESANHTHTWSWSGSTGAGSDSQNVFAVGTGVSPNPGTHTHAETISETTDIDNGSHNHSLGAPYGIYVLLCEKL